MNAQRILAVISIGVLGLVLLGSTGCQQTKPAIGQVPATAGPLGGGAPPPPPPPIDPTKVAVADDIVDIFEGWSPVPWLEDWDQRVIGFKATVFFLSGKSERGAFVPGTIFCEVNTLQRGPNGRPQRQLVHRWEFDQQKAMNFRMRKKAVGGYYYGFPLTWPAELDVGGREIEVVFGYKRVDGKTILGSPHRLKVPASGEWHSPPSEQPGADFAEGPTPAAPPRPQPAAAAKAAPSAPSAGGPGQPTEDTATSGGMRVRVSVGPRPGAAPTSAPAAKAEPAKVPTGILGAASGPDRRLPPDQGKAAGQKDEGKR